MGEQEVMTWTLANGLRVVYQQRKRIDISHCGLIIDAGSRDELAQEHGLAHYIEHAMFKGTAKRKTFHILNRLDSVGGEVNAYTTKEDTSIYASFQSQHFDRAIELLSDITFHASFPEKEIEKEKDVIIDEIYSYMDTPSEIIFDEFEERIYPDQPLGRSILGTEESVKALSKSDIIAFRSGRYDPEQIVFSYFGDLDMRKVARLVDKYFSHLPSPKRPRSRTKVSIARPGDHLEDKGTHQAHVIVGGPAFGAHDDRKYSMMLLNNMLGGPAMNSLLNLNVRERHGIAYNIESNYHTYSDTGLFQIYLGTEKKMVPKALKLVERELKRLRDRALGVRQLNAAKMQMQGYIAMSQEGGSSTMLSLGKSMLLYDEIPSMQEISARFDRITSSDILAVSNEVLDQTDLCTLIYQ